MVWEGACLTVWIEVFLLRIVGLLCADERYPA